MMKHGSEKRTRLGTVLLICLLALFCCSGAGAEAVTVSVRSLSAPTEVSQYSTVTLSVEMTYTGTPAGNVEFAAKRQGASDYTVLVSLPVTSAAMSATSNFAQTGAYTVRARYVPASGETDYAAGTEQYQTVNVRGAKTSNELVTAFQNSSGTRTITMDGDISLMENVIVNGDVTLTGGHTLSRGNAIVSFWFNANASLTVTNTLIDGKDLGSTSPMFMLGASCELVLSEGARVTNVKCESHGAVVSAFGGSVKLMQNAQIDNCTASANGMFYLTNNSTITLTDSARIADCSAADGGAIYLDQSTADIGGSAIITGCTATGFGGGVAAVNGSKINLSDDAAISACTAKAGGGASADASTLTLKNHASVAGNTATQKGGGAYLKGNQSKLTMEGDASIKNNQTTTLDTAEFLGGGGVRMEAGAQAEMSGNATVANNTANHDGGGFNIEDRAVLTMSGNASITGNEATNGYGGGVNVDYGAKLTMTGNSTISKNTAKLNGGGVDLDGLLRGSGQSSASATTVTLSDYAAITGNACEVNGGGVMVYKYCTLTLKDNAVITLNNAKDGAGVYVQGVNDNKTTYDKTIVNISGSAAISGNTATTNGGGMHLYYATLNQSGGAIANNKAARGGGVYVAPACSVINMTGTAMIADNEASDNGGGVCVISGDKEFENGNSLLGGLNMKDHAAILNNKAAGYGGGIYLRLTSVSYNDAFHVDMSGNSSISGNEASKNTSGYFNNTSYSWPSSQTNLAISYLYLSDSANLSGNKGGDFYFLAPLMCDKNFHDTFIKVKNRYTGSCGIYHDAVSRNLNCAVAYGDKSYTLTSQDAYCFYNNNDINGHYEVSDSWTYTDSNKNDYTYAVRNIYLKTSGADRRVTAYWSDTETALSNYTYKAWSQNLNRAFNSDDVYNSSHKYIWVQVNSPETTGESLEARNGKVLTITGAQITRAANYTGSLFTVKSGGTLILDGVRLDGGGTAVASPLVIVEDGATLIVRNGATLTNNNNTSSNAPGGAICGKDDANPNNGTSTIYIQPGAVITGNTHSTGGAVYSAGILVMSGGTIGKNKATGNGGGIYSSGSFTQSGGSGIVYRMSGGTIAGNTAGNGGGVYLASTGQITGGIIENNTATANGGGVYVTNTGSLSMTNGQIRGNNAAASGGGIATAANINIGGGIINGNKAVTGGGIAALNNVGVTLSGTSLVTDNEATGNGGGAAGGAVTVTDTARVAHNKAGGNGGGVYADASFGLSGSAMIDGNSAANGGGVYYNKPSSDKTMWCLSGTVSGNTATGDGGGIYIMGGSASNATEILIVSTAITGNTAASKGGGVYIGSDLSVKIGSSTIAENKAESGAGVSIERSAVTFFMNGVTQIGASILSNIASESGAGIFNNGGTVSLSKATISGNTAGISGGGIDHVWGDLTVTGGTSITGNRALNGNGGGALLRSGAATIESAAIEKNTAKAGSGVDCSHISTFTLGADATIDGNTLYDGGKSNLLLQNGALITLQSAAMTGKIGVTVTDTTFPRTLTTGAVATQQTVNAFYDDTELHAAALSGQNVVLGASSPVARVEINGMATAEFGTLAEAFDYVNANASGIKIATVTLLRDAEVSAPLVLNDGVTAIVSGYSIKRTAAYASAGSTQNIFLNKGVLTLGAITLEGSPDKTTGPLVYNENMSEVTIDGAVLKNNVSPTGAVQNWGRCVMKSGTITGCASGSTHEVAASAVWNVCNLILSGGSITGNTGESVAVLSYNLISGVNAGLTLGGTVITNNSAGGVKHYGTAGLTLTGSPVVTDNAAFNLYLPNNIVGKIDGTLGDKARVGVTTQTLPVLQPADKTKVPVMTGAAARDIAFILSDRPSFVMSVDGTTMYLGIGNRTIPAPTAQSVTIDSVTLNPVTPSVSGAGDVIEYGCTTTNASAPTAWQESPVFTGLTPETTYYFWAHVVNGTDYPPAESAPSAGIVTTNSFTVTLTKQGAGIAGFETSATGADGSWTTYSAPIVVNHGTDLYIKANLVEGYSFVQWADGITANPYKIENITVNTAFTPTASLNTYTVTLNKQGAGITGFETSATGADGSWIAYSAPMVVNHGTDLYIKANLVDGYSFVQWADGITMNPYKIENITVNKAFTPTASLNTYTVTLTKQGVGITGFETSATGADGSWTSYSVPVIVNHGTDLYIKANLVDGYSFVQWADGITMNPYKVENITLNKAFTPTASLDTYTVTLNKQGAGIAGFETSMDGTLWTAYSAPVVVPHGSSLYIKTNLVNGYSFVQWADGIAQNPYKVENITVNQAFTPTASLDTYTVTLTKQGAGIMGFETSADGTFWTAYSAPVVVPHGSNLYIKANLANGYSFVNWANGITKNPYKLENILQSKAFTPDAALVTYPVTYDDNGATTAHTGGDTSYTVLTTAFSLPGAPKKITGGVVYTFTGWKVTTGAAGGTGFVMGDVLTGASRALTGAYGSVTLTAQWSTEPVITAQPADQTVTEGERATFRVTATGIPAPAYQWQIYSGGAWKDIAGATGAQYTTDAVTQAMNGTKYRCLAGNSFKQGVVSAVATLNVKVKTIDPPTTDNKINGIEAGERFTKGQTITFTAIGGGMENENPVVGDCRWKPLKWATNPSGTFENGVMVGFDTSEMTVGVHTLTVWFEKQRFDGANWVSLVPAVTDTKTVQFEIKAAPVPPITGDGSAPELWAALCVLALLGGVALLRKKRA